MSYQLKRINPFWKTHPMVPTAVVIGGILGLIGFMKEIGPAAILGGVVAGLAIFFATRPVVSLVLGTLGLLGGLATFVIVPNIQSAGMPMMMKLLSTGLFAVFYMILMDALVLMVSGLYNLFAGAIGLGGIRLELETEAEEGD